MPLLDEDGKRIRGKANDNAADLALARMKAAGKWGPSAASAPDGERTVVQVCSGYIQYCQQGLKNGTIIANPKGIPNNAPIPKPASTRSVLRPK